MKGNIALIMMLPISIIDFFVGGLSISNHRSIRNNLTVNDTDIGLSFKNIIKDDFFCKITISPLPLRRR
jgi:hypothetical protein